MTYEEERIKLETINVDIKTKQLEAKLQRKKAHKEFVKKHKKLLFIMDIFVILILLANFGAVMITNALVVKATPEVKIMEANSVQAELNNYEEHPEGNTYMRMLLIQSIMWALILSAYIHTRFTMYKNSELMITTIILVFYTYIIFFDFFNDLGFLLGVKLFGGG